MNEANREIAPIQHMSKTQGPLTAQGYLWSGGNGNIAQSAHDFLQKNNLPGQMITGALAQDRAKDPQFQTNQRLSQGNVSISPQEQRQTQSQAITPVIGSTGEMTNVLAPRISQADTLLTRAIHPDDLSMLNQSADILGDNANKGTPQFNSALKNVQALADTYLPKRFQTATTPTVVKALLKGTP